MDARPVDPVASPAERLRYTHSWLRRYRRAEGADERVKRAEMAAFEELTAGLAAGQGSAGPGAAGQGAGMLDVGTCTGRYLRWGMRAGYSPVCGVDRSADAVRHCSADPSLRGARIVLADILAERTPARLLAGGAPFSLATMMFGTINHFTGSEQLRALAQMRRCIAAGGALVVSTWLPGALRFSLYDTPARRFLADRTMGRPRLMRLVAAAGLELQATGVTDCHLLALARLPDRPPERGRSRRRT